MNELKEKYGQYFDAHPSADAIHVTTDGMVFLHSNHNDAVNHQRQFTDKDNSAKLLTVYRREMDKPDVKEEVKTPADLSIVPDDKMKKEDIAAWLNSKQPDVKYTGKEKKEELLAAVKAIVEKV